MHSNSSSKWGYSTLDNTSYDPIAKKSDILKMSKKINNQMKLQQKYIECQMNSLECLISYLSLLDKKIDRVSSSITDISKDIHTIKSQKQYKYNKYNNHDYNRYSRLNRYSKSNIYTKTNKYKSSNLDSELIGSSLNSRFRSAAKDKDKNETFTLDPILNVTPISSKYSTSNKNTEPNESAEMVIHIENFNPKSSNISITDILGSLLSRIDKSKKNKDIKNKDEKNDDNYDDNIYEYDSDDEFEEIGKSIKTLDDLIDLCNLYETILDDTPNNINIKNDINNDTNKKTKNKKNSGTVVKNHYEINGKKYSINLKTLYNLRGPLKKLHSMIGLKSIKDSIIDMVLYYLQHFENKNNNMLHTIIEGPPGVGKTELGKIIADIYAKLGIIKSNKFKLVKRTDLIGKYLGHTAEKTQQVIDDANGGVLFIDEAYSLGNNETKDSYAKECIDTINQNLSENKNRFICIIAGYANELDKCFFSYNRGLKRRFPFRYSITGYDHIELRDIFLKKLKDIKWTLCEDMNMDKLTKFFKDNLPDFPYYGGDIDNLIIDIKFMHSRRVMGKHPKYRRKLSNKDIMNGLKRFKDNKKKKSSDTYRHMYL